MQVSKYQRYKQEIIVKYAEQHVIFLGRNIYL